MVRTKRNNSKARRERKQVLPKGPTGTPHPMGNRAYRRSPQGRAAFADMLAKLAEQAVA